MEGQGSSVGAFSWIFTKRFQKQYCLKTVIEHAKLNIELVLEKTL